MRLSSPQYHTSPLSRFCDEELPGDFHYLDGDEVLFKHSALPITYARETGVLRILESKNSGEQIRRSQRETFPLLAAAISVAVGIGVVAEGSGVFVVEVEGEPPWLEGATVHKVRPVTNLVAGLQYEWSKKFSRLELSTFMRCREAVS